MKEIKTRNTRIADLCSTNGKNQNNSKRLTQKQRSNNPVHGWLRHNTMKHLHLVPLWWNHNFLTCVKMSPEFTNLRFEALLKLQLTLMDISDTDKMKMHFQRLDSRLSMRGIAQIINLRLPQHPGNSGNSRMSTNQLSRCNNQETMSERTSRCH